MNYTEMIAKGLKQHCEFWEYDHINKLKEDCSLRNFHKLFCGVTNTYFINEGDSYFTFGKDVNYYDVSFDKKEGIATVKRCGTEKTMIYRTLLRKS